MGHLQTQKLYLYVMVCTHYTSIYPAKLKACIFSSGRGQVPCSRTPTQNLLREAGKLLNHTTYCSKTCVIPQRELTRHHGQLSSTSGVKSQSSSVFSQVISQDCFTALTANSPTHELKYPTICSTHPPIVALHTVYMIFMVQ